MGCMFFFWFWMIMVVDGYGCFVLIFFGCSYFVSSNLFWLFDGFFEIVVLR